MGAWPTLTTFVAYFVFAAALVIAMLVLFIGARRVEQKHADWLAGFVVVRAPDNTADLDRVLAHDPGPEFFSTESLFADRGHRR